MQITTIKIHRHSVPGTLSLSPHLGLWQENGKEFVSFLPINMLIVGRAITGIFSSVRSRVFCPFFSAFFLLPTELAENVLRGHVNGWSQKMVRDTSNLHVKWKVIMNAMPSYLTTSCFEEFRNSLWASFHNSLQMDTKQLRRKTFWQYNRRRWFGV